MRFQSFALVGLLSSTTLATPKVKQSGSGNPEPIDDSGKGAPLLGNFYCDAFQWIFL